MGKKSGKKIITKELTVSVDIDLARLMLSVAGFDVKNLTDEEIFYKAINISNAYGVTLNNENNK